MPNTYTQIHIQFVFAVRYGAALIDAKWQEGYGAFSYGRSQVDDVIRYFQNQEIHHRKETFLDEYKKILNAFDIQWEEPYIFKELE